MSAINFVLEGKKKVLGSDDKKSLTYFIPLANFKKGFDYYDFKKDTNGNVFIEIETMLGLKSVIKTYSPHFETDLTHHQWVDIIFKTATEHFNKEEYVALKKRYVKKASNNSGCMLTLLLLIVTTFLTIYFI